MWLRPPAVVGVLFLLNLTLAAWWEPGHGAPLWRYFGARLDTLPLMLLLIIFYAADAGRGWGLDGWRHRSNLFRFFHSRKRFHDQQGSNFWSTGARTVGTGDSACCPAKPQARGCARRAPTRRQDRKAPFGPDTGD